MQNSQDELVAKLKQAQNVLVTVSRDPSVDQLSAAIGLTVALNNMEKHASAVFSGQVPSTIEFLQPEETLEKNTDSLRDFIIALDKSKADKLRYKVEDSVVRIFITPYKTSISQDDLDFSQGDFNVDVVVALGVQAQQDLDDAIQAHGRILHDATVATVTLDGQSDLGTLHVSGNGATSLSELVADMVGQMDKKVLDSQTATALLTGIVSVTERFRNDKTTPKTMSISSALMAAGANQQLIANELDAEPEPNEEVALPIINDEVPADIEIDTTGTLAISHEEPEDEAEPQPAEETVEAEQESQPPAELPEENNTQPAEDVPYPNTRGRVIEPPSHGGTLTANTEEEPLDKPTEELTLPTQADAPMLSHDSPVAPIDVPSDYTTVTLPEPEQPFAPQPVVPSQPPVFEPMAQPGVEVPEPISQPMAQASQSTEPTEPEAPVKTLEDLERELGATHTAEESTEQPAYIETPQHTPEQVQANDAEAARQAVEAALTGVQPVSPDPIVALNAQPLGDDLHSSDLPAVDPVATDLPAEPPVLAPDPTYERPESASAFPGVVPESHQEDEGEAAPPVPPPFVPPTA